MPVNFRGAKNIQIHDSNIQDIVGNNNTQGRTSLSINSGNTSTTTTTNSHNDSSTTVGLPGGHAVPDILATSSYTLIAAKYSSRDYPEPMSSPSFITSGSQDTYKSSAGNYATRIHEEAKTQAKAVAPGRRSEVSDPHVKHLYGPGTREKTVLDNYDDCPQQKSPNAFPPRRAASCAEQQQRPDPRAHARVKGVDSLLSWFRSIAKLFSRS